MEQIDGSYRDKTFPELPGWEFSRYYLQHLDTGNRYEIGDPRDDTGWRFNATTKRGTNIWGAKSFHEAIGFAFLCENPSIEDSL